MIKFSLTLLLPLIFISNIYSHDKIRTIGEEDYDYSDFTLSKNGIVVFASREKMIYAYNIHSGLLLDTMDYCVSSDIQSIALSSDSSLLISGLKNGEVIIHNLQTNERKVLKVANSDITALDLNCELNTLIAGTRNGEIIILNFSGDLLFRKQIHIDLVNRIIINPDDNTFFSSSFDGTIACTRLDETSGFTILTKESKICSDIAYNRLNHTLVGGFYDNKAKTWVKKNNNELLKGKKIKLKGWVSGVSYYPELRTWAACSVSGEVIFVTDHYKYKGRYNEIVFKKVELIPNNDRTLIIIVSSLDQGLKVIYASDLDYI